LKPAGIRKEHFNILYGLRNDYSGVRTTDKGYTAFLDICVRPIMSSKLFNVIMNGEESIKKQIPPDCEALGIVLLLNAHLKWEEEAQYRKVHGLGVDDKLPAEARDSFSNNEYTESELTHSSRRSGWSPEGLNKFMVIKSDIIKFRLTNPLKQKGNEKYAKECLGMKRNKRKVSGAGVAVLSESEVKRLRALETAYNNPMMSIFAKI